MTDCRRESEATCAGGDRLLRSGQEHLIVAVLIDRGRRLANGRDGGEVHQDDQGQHDGVFNGGRTAFGREKS